VRPGRVVVHLVLGQDGAQVALAERESAQGGSLAPQALRLVE
jgi:hypothetical protein